MDLSLYAGDDTIKPVSVVRHLGVLLNEELTAYISLTAYGISLERNVIHIIGRAVRKSQIHDCREYRDFGHVP